MHTSKGTVIAKLKYLCAVKKALVLRPLWLSLLSEMTSFIIMLDLECNNRGEEYIDVKPYVFIGYLHSSAQYTGNDSCNSK